MSSNHKHLKFIWRIKKHKKWINIDLLHHRERATNATRHCCCCLHALLATLVYTNPHMSQRSKDFSFWFDFVNEPNRYHLIIVSPTDSRDFVATTWSCNKHLRTKTSECENKKNNNRSRKYRIGWRWRSVLNDRPIECIANIVHHRYSAIRRCIGYNLFIIVFF